MKYRVAKACSWKTFVGEPSDEAAGAEPKVLAAADLVTADGKPLPAEVVAHFATSGALVAADDKEPE